MRRARKSGKPVLLGPHGARAGAPSTRARSSSPHAPSGEHWFCFEQPDRDGSALAALGEVTRLTASGPKRFREVSAAWRELAA